MLLVGRLTSNTTTALFTHLLVSWQTGTFGGSMPTPRVLQSSYVYAVSGLGRIERVVGQCAEFDSRLLPHSHHTQRPHSVDEILSRFRPQTHEGHTFSVGSLRTVRAHVGRPLVAPSFGARCAYTQLCHRMRRCLH
uniref:Putative secreted protein n=1 Tax=Anopheles marajoara TaxID=58244 RepID=A0A2M4C7R8_9DIPT